MPLASSFAARHARVTRGRTMRVGRDGAPRHRARRTAHVHARTQLRTRGRARAGVARGLCRALRVAHEAAGGAREARARRGRAGCVDTARRAALHMRESTPLPCTSARSLWLCCSLLLGRSRSGRPASQRGGWVVAHAVEWGCGRALRCAARPARAWVGLLTSLLLLPPLLQPNTQRGSNPRVFRPDNPTLSPVIAQDNERTRRAERLRPPTSERI